MFTERKERGAEMFTCDVVVSFFFQTMVTNKVWGRLWLTPPAPCARWFLIHGFIKIRPDSLGSVHTSYSLQTFFFSRCFKCGKKWGGGGQERRLEDADRNEQRKRKNKQAVPQLDECEGDKPLSTPTEHPFIVLWSLSNVKPPPAVKAY